MVVHEEYAALTHRAVVCPLQSATVSTLRTSGFGPSHFLHRRTLLGGAKLCGAPRAWYPQYSGASLERGLWLTQRISFSVRAAGWPGETCVTR